MQDQQLHLYTKIALWVALGDGDLAHAEKAMLFRRLKKKFSSITDLEDILDREIKAFSKDYDKSVEQLKEELFNSDEISFDRQSLLKFAQQSVVDDGKLTPGEEYAINEIAEVLKK